jgi:hypothetical protein
MPEGIIQCGGGIGLGDFVDQGLSTGIINSLPRSAAVTAVAVVLLCDNADGRLSFD